ncbi:hypothetical protein B0H21DRAFT_33968 [Amylocystis lapponica]|nr:hypothetical protein B0H21DRAFT_33968 [Amylocystis lapponica]
MCASFLGTGLTLTEEEAEMNPAPGPFHFCSSGMKAGAITHVLLTSSTGSLRSLRILRPSSLPAKPMHGKLGRAGSLGPAPARTAQIIRCAKSLLSPAPRSPSSLPGLLHSFPCRPRILAQPRPVPSLHPYPSSCGAALCQAAQPGPGPLVLARDSAGGLLLRPCASCAQGLGSGTHPGTNLPGADHTHGGRRVSESTRLCQWRCAETSETASRTVSVRVLGVRVPRPRSSVRRRAAARGRAGLQASRCSGACRLACCALLSSILCACEV